MTLRCLVVDDEPLARDELAFLLGQCAGVEVVGEAMDARSALLAVDEHEPDVVFLDLRMPGPDGISLAQALQGRNAETALVIVSAHDEGALRAFEANVLDYLLKPVRLNRLKSTIERARKRTETGGAPDVALIEPLAPLERLAVRRKGGLSVIEISQVVFFEVKDELVWAVTETDRFGLDLPLSEVAARVNESFFRSHRSALVRLDRIKRLEPTGAGTFDLILDHPDSPRVPLARERARKLKALIPVAG